MGVVVEQVPASAEAGPAEAAWGLWTCPSVATPVVTLAAIPMSLSTRVRNAWMAKCATPASAETLARVLATAARA
jgi:NADH:ubiquinone oxidoreductase subunit F (NADH-binding)